LAQAQSEQKGITQAPRKNLNAILSKSLQFELCSTESFGNFYFITKEYLNTYPVQYFPELDMTNRDIVGLARGAGL
jgi:hypothetical protein